MQVAIIDTGSANLNSVVQALKRLDADPVISSDLLVLSEASHLIFPGVGTAAAVMEGVNSRQLHDFIVTTKKPLLGICLGMQVLGRSSTEVPLHSVETEIKTLGIVSGRVQKLKASGLRLPHMGWNTVRHGTHPLFEGIRNEAFFYFDHSFAMETGAFTIGETEYGEKFSSAVAADNFMGVQFHPEKSGAVGARLLSNFLNNF